MEITRILWSGLSGRIGQEAMEQLKKVTGVEIVAGLKRETSGADDINLGGGIYENVKWLSYKTGIDGLFGLVKQAKYTEANVIVDFSHPDVFEKVVELAIRLGVPLISGTSGLSDRQIAMLYDATNQIPVFRGGNFRFKVKKFMDECVKVAICEAGSLYLYANSSPNVTIREIAETSNTIYQRVKKMTGRQVCAIPADYFPERDNTIDWELRIQKSRLESVVGASCRVIGFDELAYDVLAIAKVMAKKQVKKGEFYDLDELWDDLVSWAL